MLTTEHVSRGNRGEPATIRWALGFVRVHMANAAKALKRRDYRGAWASLSCAEWYAESAASMQEWYAESAASMQEAKRQKAQRRKAQRSSRPAGSR